jgi:hypothetical protein
MIEQYLQVALEFVKEIWFQLDSQFGLEGTEAFKFIHPYLLQLEDNPAYMGIAFAALVLVPFGLYKVRSISREREQKLDDLMEEMEEDEGELDENDPSRLRRPDDEETATALDDDEEGDKPLFEMEEEDPPPYVQILEKLDAEENEDELHVDTQKVMGEDKVIEPVSSELAELQIDKDLSEFDSDPVESDSPHDQTIQELQEDGQLTELEGVLSPDDPFANYSELDDDEQNRAIQELQGEMESTINKLTKQMESTPETTSTIKDLGDIRIGDVATIDEEFTLDEEFPLEEPLETSEPAPEPLSLEALDLANEIEPAIENIEPAIKEIETKLPPFQPVPERDYVIEDRPDRQVDSLINRLKYFQENLDTRFHHDEKRELTSAPKTVDIAEEHRFVEQQSFATKKAPVDNKKYMEVLESFIFLKDQNKHK